MAVTITGHSHLLDLIGRKKPIISRLIHSLAAGLKEQLVQRARKMLRSAVIGNGRTVVGTNIGKVIDRENSRLCLLDAAFGNLVPVDGDRTDTAFAESAVGLEIIDDGVLTCGQGLGRYNVPLIKSEIVVGE